MPYEFIKTVLNACFKVTFVDLFGYRETFSEIQRFVDKGEGRRRNVFYYYMKIECIWSWSRS